MRDLFRVLAAREKDPVLSAKPARYLDADDIRILQERASRLTAKEFNEYLYRIQEEDLRAMLRLAKMQQIDQEITLLLNLLTGSAKVSGWADDGRLKISLTAFTFR